MNWASIDFDWNHVRSFLATAEEGSLSAAARVLGVTQPTLSRQVASLEAELGVTLFERGTRAMTLTTAGLSLIEHVRAMSEAAQRISLAATGQAESIVGRVSITATDLVATHHLPAILRRIADEAPDLVIEVVASNEVRDLTRREADIAVRHAQPEQLDLIAKKVTETEAHFYVSPAFIERYGVPETAEALSASRFIGMVDTERMVGYLTAYGLTVSADNFRAVTMNGTAMVEFVREGLGVGILTAEAARRHPELQRIMPELPPFEIPVWLVTHRELRTSRRIRLVFDILAEELKTRWHQPV